MLHLSPILPLVVLLPILAGLAFADLATCRKLGKRILISRSIIWAVVIALSLRPAQVSVKEIVDRARLIILEDHSDSMLVMDAGGGKSRQQAIEEARGSNAQAFTELEQHFEIEELQFAESAVPAGAPLNTSTTAIGEALSSIAADAEGTRLAGIVLLSDGRTTAGRSPAAGTMALAAAKVPVHTVQVGQTDLPQNAVDVAILDIEAPLTAEAGGIMTVAVTGTTRNLDDVAIDFFASINEDPPQKIHTITPTSTDTSFRELIQIPVPDETGFHTLTVSATAPGHEITPANNRLQTPFRARDDAIRILFLEGALRPEFKFIRRVLEDNNAFSATIAPPFLLASPAGKSFLKDLRPERFDVVILGDLARNRLPPGLGDGIASLVKKRGAGLLILGGTRNLDPNHWRGHPLEAALPIVFDTTARPPETQDFQPRPAPNARHFIAAPFDSPTYSRVWSLPPLRGLRAPGTAATPLATTLLIDQSDRALIVSSDYGAGRVIFTLTDATWNWQTEPEPAPAFHREFWTRTIYYLASREEVMNSRLSIASGRARIRQGKPIVVYGDLLNQAGSPVTDAGVELRLRNLEDDTTTTIPMPHDGSRYSAAPIPEQAGQYAIQAFTQSDGEELPSNELRIAVFDAKLEDRNVLADPTALENIAKTTNGTSRKMADLDSLLTFLPSLARTVTVRKTEYARTLWDAPIFLFILLAAATVCWLPAARRPQ